MFILNKMITTIEEYDKIRIKLGLSDRQILTGMKRAGHPLNKDFFSYWRNERVKCPHVENLKKVTEYLDALQLIKL